MNAPLAIPEDLEPQFSLAAYVPADGDRGEVDLIIHQTVPSIRRHASQALLYGLAIMTLDQQGVIADTIDALLAAGPINEVDAVNRIALLMQQESHDLPH
ncbi:hypothetical protein D869_gp320 [Caulobacter phage CcrRogue]|uniref:Uncharacterized protein n=1 Tax=Caulobacter phage CcrRogue TaxID=2927986 RepID=K4JN09_9CAUD|nr:hypothetical protein D869_gp320 [Caulobacter phage CcrRogue]AFU86594.1 hypothetical protein CcrRogue_gp112 [Caulobacter phage CcrRogue]